MADVINLRQARKAKAREVKERQAETNRALHGQTKAEKQKRRAEDARLKQHLDEHRLDSSDDETIPD